jgi:hypothetical protein
MSEASQRHAFDLFADYFEVYIEDETADVSPDEAGNAWTDEAIRNLLAPARGSVRIQRAAASASVPGCHPRVAARSADSIIIARRHGPGMIRASRSSCSTIE